jgi:hypothetical protein
MKAMLSAALAIAALAVCLAPAVAAETPAPAATAPAGRATETTAPAAPAPAKTAEAAAPAAAEPKPVLAQWQSLYLARKKIGYITQSLYDLPGRGRRLQTNLFLARAASADKLGYFKMITADVDSRFRPLALECRVTSGERSWQVKGQVEDREFVMTRTVGDKSATARVPLDEEVTFLSWTLPATVLAAGAPGVPAGPGAPKPWLATGA